MGQTDLTQKIVLNIELSLLGPSFHTSHYIFGSVSIGHQCQNFTIQLGEIDFDFENRKKHRNTVSEIRILGRRMKSDVKSDEMVEINNILFDFLSRINLLLLPRAK